MILALNTCLVSSIFFNVQLLESWLYFFNIVKISLATIGRKSVLILLHLWNQRLEPKETRERIFESEEGFYSSINWLFLQPRVQLLLLSPLVSCPCNSSISRIPEPSWPFGWNTLSFPVLCESDIESSVLLGSRPIARFVLEPAG